jgi:hypothetical protein
MTVSEDDMDCFLLKCIEAGRNKGGSGFLNFSDALPI